MNRLLAAILTLLLLASPAFAEAPSLFAFDNIAMKGEGTLEQKLDDLKALGYSGLAWTGTDVAKVRSVIDEAEQRGLKLQALYVAFPLAADRVEVPPNLDEVLSALQGHHTILWVYLQSKAFKPSDPAGDSVAVPALRDIADRAAKHHVKVALYPHTAFWNEKLADNFRLAEKVNRANFGVSLNLCHALKTGDEANLPKLIRQNKRHLFMVTVNGADANIGPKGGWDELIRPIGQGTYDLAAFVKRLRSEGFAGPFGFQGYNIKGDRRDILRQSIESWRTITAE